MKTAAIKLSLLAALCSAAACGGQDQALPKDFPSAEAIRAAWTSRVPGSGGSLIIAAARPLTRESPEGRAVLARFGWLQRLKITGIWRVGRGFGIGTKDIKAPDFKGQNNSFSSFPACYVARTPSGYWLVEVTETWAWGQLPAFGGGKARFRLEAGSRQG